MTNPNPFVPKGSLLEQQSARRSRLKLAVFCVVAVSSVGLVAMLIQGCKREQPGDSNPPDSSTNTMADTNTAPPIDTNAMVLPPSTNTTPVYVPPVTPVTPTPVVDTSTTVYEIAQGDTLGKIAKAHHVTVKELEAANPGVDPKRLKVKQKINIPASSAAAPTGTPMADVSGGGDTYVVKSGDTLGKIAKANGTTVKALEAANPGVDPNHLKVKQKLNLPVKAEAAPVAPAVTPMPAPPAASVPPVTPLPSSTTPSGK